MIPKSKHPAYQVWTSMLYRCENPKHKHWKFYGGRGIKVCRRWHKFEYFVADMGPRPKGFQIHRVNNDRGYCPSNCVWVEPREHYRNKRGCRWITFNDKTMLMYEWARHVGLNPITLLYRLKNGWPLEDALTIPTLPRVGQKGRRSWILRRDGREEELVAESKRLQAIRSKKYYDQKKADGICVICTKPALRGRVHCRKHSRTSDSCRRSNDARKAASNAARLNKIRAAGWTDYCDNNGTFWKYHRYVNGRCDRCGHSKEIWIKADRGRHREYERSHERSG